MPENPSFRLFGSGFEHAVDDDAMTVNVSIKRRAEAMDEGARIIGVGGVIVGPIDRWRRDGDPDRDVVELHRRG